jgi:hypothetical protein
MTRAELLVELRWKDINAVAEALLRHTQRRLNPDEVRDTASGFKLNFDVVVNKKTPPCPTAGEDARVDTPCCIPQDCAPAYIDGSRRPGSYSGDRHREVRSSIAPRLNGITVPKTAARDSESQGRKWQPRDNNNP